MCKYISMYIYVCMYVCACLYTYIHTYAHTYIYIYIQGAHNMFPDFFRMGTFIDSTHIKL